MALLFRLWLLTLLAGCAAAPPTETPSFPGPAIRLRAGADHGWWYAAFRFRWPAGEEPGWHRGVMVAHRLIAPIVNRHAGDIALWRIHRRAARDGGGHRFSFIFYATPQVARQVYAELEAAPDLRTLRRQGVIEQVFFDDTDRIARPRLEDTSDPHWPKIVQETWPAYIMGVSVMWLELVKRLAAARKIDVPEEDAYRKLSADLDRLWAANARHAYLHHLNAVYAYRPFWIRY